jgi:protein tyrosine phosphatase (PTP) superfamily phosphohydrolase (DUF442 family)
MPEEPLQNLRNFRRFDAFTAGSGQPTEEQFQDVAASGVQCVINLALPTSTYALPDERGVVTRLGMEYVHIPVSFEEPQVADYLKFEEAMDRSRDVKLLVHCAMNFRASAFIALYRIRRTGADRDAALHDMRSVWQPDAAWSKLIDTLLAS